VAGDLVGLGIVGGGDPFASQKAATLSLELRLLWLVSLGVLSWWQGFWVLTAVLPDLAVFG
jgi:hypothetical protein